MYILLECFEPISIRYSKVEGVTYSVLVYFLEHTDKDVHTITHKTQLTVKLIF